MLSLLVQVAAALGSLRAKPTMQWRRSTVPAADQGRGMKRSAAALKASAASTTGMPGQPVSVPRGPTRTAMLLPQGYNINMKSRPQFRIYRKGFDVSVNLLPSQPSLGVLAIDIKCCTCVDVLFPKAGLARAKYAAASVFHANCFMQALAAHDDSREVPRDGQGNRLQVRSAACQQPTRTWYKASLAFSAMMYPPLVLMGSIVCDIAALRSRF